MPKYRVRPDQVVNQSGQLFRAGEELEIPKHVAYELRSLVEAVDAEGELPPGPASTVLMGAAMQENLRAHERRGVLQLQRDELNKQLKFIDSQLVDLDTEIKQEAEARQKRTIPQQSQPNDVKKK